MLKPSGADKGPVLLRPVRPYVAREVDRALATPISQAEDLGGRQRRRRPLPRAELGLSTHRVDGRHRVLAGLSLELEKQGPCP